MGTMPDATRSTLSMKQPHVTVGWLPALIGAVAAAATAVGLMFWIRSAFQIRTLPERLLEWILLFVPPDQFEAGIQRFGSDAKVYALYVAVVGSFLALAIPAAVVIRRGPIAIWVAGVVLWLFAMAVVFPVTGGGFFASTLPQDPYLANAGYLLLALAFVTVLLGVRALAIPRTIGASNAVHPDRNDATRRALLVGAGGTAASIVATYALSGRSGIRNDIPLAIIDVPAAAPPPVATSAPVVVNTVVAATNPVAPSNPIATPAATAITSATKPTSAPVAATPVTAPVVAAKPDEIPQPPPPRQVKREHDGASTAVPRKNGELAKLFTSNDDFFITTKNPVSDPVVDGSTWRMVIEGEVGKPVALDYRTLRKLPAVEFARTLECISNFVDKPELAPFGNNLISTAMWKGVRLGDAIGLAGGLKPGATFITLVTADEFNAVIPASAVDDPECPLAYEMNGTVLPREHGYPTRLLMPGRYGLKSAKWIIAIRPQLKETVDWYGQRGWSKEAIAKTMSRIDMPGTGVVLSAGPQRMAGIAYGSNRGIQKVEFSADGGKSWTQAELGEQPKPGSETWILWQGMFQMPATGTVTLRARATDGKGALQIEEFSLPQPNGATGWHTVEVKSSGAA